MLSRVNEDCLLIISKYLSLQNHAAMVYASSHLGSTIQELYRTRSIETSCEFWRYAEENKFVFDKFWDYVSATLQTFLLEPKEDHHMDMIRSWRLTNLKSFEFSISTNLKVPLESLVIFLQHSCKYLKHLTLRDVHWQHFRALYHLRFPNLTHLELSAKHYLFKPDEKFRGEIFPKLRTLILKGVASYEGVWNFYNLTDLTIGKSAQLRPSHLERILLNCPLKKLSINCMMDSHHGQYLEDEIEHCRNAINQLEDSLEEIYFDYHYLCMFASELPNLKKLRKFGFLPPSYCMCNCKLRDMPTEMADYLGKVTKRLVLTHAELPENWTALQRFMQNLQKVESLKIIFTCCTPEHILTLAKKLSSNLKEFHFHGVLESDALPTFARTDYSCLLNVLRYCGGIELLNLSDTYCNEKFFGDALATIRQNFGERKRPLVFRLNRTKCKLRNLKKLKLPEFVQFSTEETNYSCAKLGIQCEW